MIRLKVLSENLKEGAVKLIPETEDDLWYLSQIIEEEDFVKGLTFRRVEGRDDALRAESAEKKPVVLGIRVKNVELKEFGAILRVSGIIETGEMGQGNFHTINVEPGKDILLVKQVWTEGMKKLLQEALSARHVEIVFVALDDASAVLATLTERGVKTLAEINAHISGKDFEGKKEQEKGAFYAQVLETLERVVEPNTVVVVLGPGFWKEEFYELVKERVADLAARTTVLNASSGGIAGINEVLKKEITMKGLSEAKVKVETEYVERFFAEIAREGNVAYGINEVNYAVEIGAAEVLLILTTLLRKKEMEKILKAAQATRCKIVSISPEHEAGRRLSAVGGIGAILRYRIEGREKDRD
ncbi:MAG: mRNA surveillance protein pelota [Thermoplasmata archaeon]|nr:mRNA surveillance protein pelota [Thermoplasmata archaeon]